MKVGSPVFGRPLLFSQADSLLFFLDNLSDAFLVFSFCSRFSLRLFRTHSWFSHFAAAFSSVSFGRIPAFLIWRPLFLPPLSDAFLLFSFCGRFFFRLFRTHSCFSHFAAAFSSASFGRIPGFLTLRLLFLTLLSDAFLVFSLCGRFSRQHSIWNAARRGLFRGALTRHNLTRQHSIWNAARRGLA